MCLSIAWLVKYLPSMHKVLTLVPEHHIKQCAVKGAKEKIPGPLTRPET